MGIFVKLNVKCLKQQQIKYKKVEKDQMVVKLI